MAWLPSEKRAYNLGTIERHDVLSDPVAQFSNWFANITTEHYPEPNAMVLSTANDAGCPSSRIVLLKHYDELGFVFFTNYTSRKAQEITDNHHGCMLFYWAHHERQVRIEGRITQIDNAASDAYFKTRPRASQIAAYASHQSAEIPDRQTLIDRIEVLESQFLDKPVPRPDTWGGYCLKPEYYEFWQGRNDRCHDRIFYKKQDHHWKIGRLSP